MKFFCLAWYNLAHPYLFALVSVCVLLWLKDGKCLIINVFLSIHVTVHLQNNQNA